MNFLERVARVFRSEGPALVGPPTDLERPNLDRAMRRERAHDARALERWRAAPDFGATGLEASSPFMMEDEPLPPQKAVATVPTVYGCIDLLKNALAKLPLRFYLGAEADAEEVEAEPGNVVWLFQNPNPDTRNESGFEIVEQICASLDLDGNAYLFMDAEPSGLVTELTVLPAHITTPIPGPGNTIARYEVKWQGKTLKLPPEQVIHFRYWSPFVGLKGLSPMGAAALSYKTQRLAQRWNFGIYERGGEASGYFTSEQIGVDGAKRERMELSIRQRYRGPEHAGRPIILPRGLKRESSMLSHEQMKFIESYKLTKADVFEVFSIPPWMKGLKEGSSLGDSGAGTDERLFWENAIEPRALRISRAITTKMLHRIAPDLFCKFDFSRVWALQKVRLDRAKALREALGAPYMTTNETRKEDGLPPLDGEEWDLPPKQPAAPGAAQPADPSQDPNKTDPKPGEPAKKSRAGEPDPATARAEARAEFRKRHDADLARFERRMERVFRKIFNGQERAIVNALEGDGRGPADREAIRTMGELAANLEALRVLDLDQYLAEDDADDLALIRQGLEFIMETQGSAALAALGLKLDLDLTAANAGAFVSRHALRALTEVNRTTKIALRESVAEGLAKQESLAEITARVREVFNDRRANAQTIARTETNPAYQFATTEAWKQSEIVEGREWVAIHDDVVRPEHEDADGQVVGIEEPFEVGGELLEFPGDPTGSASNVINCRCGMLAVLKEDSRLTPAARWLGRGLRTGSRTLAPRPSNRLREYLRNGNGKHAHH